MTTNPFTITVYIPSYNQIEYLQGAIESVLNQTRVPDQILIVDDASTDGSQELIREYQSKHPEIISTVFNESRQGIGSVRRIAIEASTGDFVTYLDGDDLYYPQKIEAEESALVENPDAGYVYSNFHFIDEQGREGEVWNDTGQYPTGDIFDHYMGFDFPGGVSNRCELVRRKILIETDHYESGLNLYQVTDAMMRVARLCTCVAVSKPTHAYRRHCRGVHRKPYTTHYDALKYIYQKNIHLLDRLDAARQKKIRSKVNQVLARYAWKSVKQMAKGDPNTDSKRAICFAKAGFTHSPSSVLNPKHAIRTIRAAVR